MPHSPAITGQALLRRRREGGNTGGTTYKKGHSDECPFLFYKLICLQKGYVNFISIYNTYANNYKSLFATFVEV
jgi:hypothetical protein